MTVRCFARLFVFALVLALFPAWQIEARANPAAPSAGSVADDASEEGWSLDDVKDVFEAIHFFAITVGIGVGVWWFVVHYLRTTTALAVNLEVTRRVGFNEGQLIEVTANIRNDGMNAVRLDRCRILVAVVDHQKIPGLPAVLRLDDGLSPIMDEDLRPGATMVAAGATLRLATVLALPASLNAHLVTVRVDPSGCQSPLFSSLLEPG